MPDDRADLRAAFQAAIHQAANNRPAEHRILFTAPLAQLDEWTSEESPRRLETPRSDVLQHRPPLPLRGPASPLELDGFRQLRFSSSPGWITSLVHVPLVDTLFAVGWMWDYASGLAGGRLLESGKLFLELDLDADVRTSDVWDSFAGRCESFSRWGVAAATLGTHPCWDFPAASVTYPEPSCAH